MCLEKERVRSKVTPRKVGVGLKQKWELNKRRLGWRLAWLRSTKKEPSHLLGLRGRHQSSLCGLHFIMAQGGRGPNGQIINIKKTDNGRRQRSRKIIEEKREKYRAKNGSLQNTLTDSKGTTFVILKNYV